MDADLHANKDEQRFANTNADSHAKPYDDADGYGDGDADGDEDVFSNPDAEPNSVAHLYGHTDGNVVAYPDPHGSGTRDPNLSAPAWVRWLRLLLR